MTPTGNLGVLCRPSMVSNEKQARRNDGKPWNASDLLLKWEYLGGCADG